LLLGSCKFFDVCFNSAAPLSLAAKTPKRGLVSCPEIRACFVAIQNGPPAESAALLSVSSISSSSHLVNPFLAIGTNAFSPNAGISSFRTDIHAEQPSAPVHASLYAVGRCMSITRANSVVVSSEAGVCLGPCSDSLEAN
jgi:hypothetical protein